ncbi:uncharacterized protein J7T54_008122 [Emericellopsis cladophorae]|uniref:Mmc1 C-terminal domain-containing protein n=1 Tax=Emericellopsis cladophorae TaxID=2686198 RepID=A0A9P9Y7Z0_9HYPO|nr:uncharacterized protein J7T54_008122 [Emericellopsis cladophorae]KAI6785028.1 hypothetical protein J7T54_008122 [Emericellopsis cladophorae]
MSAKRQLLSQAKQWRRAASKGRTVNPSSCLRCSFATAHPPNAPRQVPFASRRLYTTSAASHDPRAELLELLPQLNAHLFETIDNPRLALVLQNLRQQAGQEAVRVAILGLESGRGGSAGSVAKKLLRVLIVDPLVDEQEWERQLDSHDPIAPLIVRIQPHHAGETQVAFSQGTQTSELMISSPAFNGLNLELLLASSTAADLFQHDKPATAEAILSPQLAVSVEHHVAPISAPVHKALLVGSGLPGAVSLSSIPREDQGFVHKATDFEGLSDKIKGDGYQVIDVARAEKAVSLFRRGPQHGIEYERQWYASGMPTLVEWLKEGLATTEEATKPIVRQSIASHLQYTKAEIEGQELLIFLGAKSGGIVSPETAEMKGAVAQWAQSAHTELQEELDRAFTGKRWRKLGWWKLFWRVDDVAMLTNEMLSSRFLPTAEQDLVYLTGRIAGAHSSQPSYTQPASSKDADKKLVTTKLGSGEVAEITPVLPKWPGHIAFTRRYLQNETIPALQALAQRLVMQSLGTSSIATSLAALLYVSSFASSLYEAGAVAALGIVYGLGRMQKKWETARGFWEGEVREEGRKAVRGAEESVGEVLDGTKSSADDARQAATLEKARKLVEQAEDALGRLK